MSTEPRSYTRAHYRGQTWLEGECDGTRRARVRFPDGKLRVVRAAGVPDTYFSIPCRSHDGYLSCRDTTWEPAGEYVFCPCDTSKARYGAWED